MEDSEVEAGTHLGVVAGTVVLTFGDGELLAEEGEGVASEGIGLACLFEGALPLELWQSELIVLCRLL